MRSIAILGTRGIPARHGGFETFVEGLAPYLAARGFRVTVYCQLEKGEGLDAQEWQGVRLARICPHFSGPLGTAEFDWKSISAVISEKPDFVFVFGYNTAVFCARLKAAGIPFALNMDGLEWKRKKWSALLKLWLRMNERAGMAMADILIADHPEIARRLKQFVPAGKIRTIGYGSEKLIDVSAEPLAALNLHPGGFGIYIGRPEPENHVLEIVRAYSKRSRGMPLVLLGDYISADKTYKKSVREAAGSEIRFLGAVYDPKIVEALLYYSRFYCHGHSVGGTNPSLVQAMAAGCRIVAHDNIFNREVLNRQGYYFGNEEDLARLFDTEEVFSPSLSGRETYPQLLAPQDVHRQYEAILESHAR